jgi:uncharacterized protein (DUF58 family)
MYAGRYDEAVTLLKRASDASTSPAEWNLAYAYYYSGRQAEAEDMMRKVRGKSANAASSAGDARELPGGERRNRGGEATDLWNSREYVQGPPRRVFARGGVRATRHA